MLAFKTKHISPFPILVNFENLLKLDAENFSYITILQISIWDNFIFVI